MDAFTYVVNVEGAVVRDGEYLLVERSAEEEHAAGLLAFPGGTVEQTPGSEDPIEATVARELREEVGLEVTSVEYVRSKTFETDTGLTCLDLVTLCRATGEATPREPEEVAAVHWLSPGEIRGHEAAPAYLEPDLAALERARRGDSG